MNNFVIPIPHGRLLQNHVIGISADVETSPSQNIVIGIQDTAKLYETSNVLFQMTIDFNQRKVFRNNYQNGAWGTHEASGSFPFIPGYYFDLSIEMKGSTFIVAVNGTRLFEYTSPIPLRLAKYIVTEGQINIEDISIGCELVMEIETDYL